MYYLIAIKRLFFARISHSNFLKNEKLGCDKSKSEAKIVRYLNFENFKDESPLDKDMQIEIEKHKLIRMSLKDSVLLFFSKYFVCTRNLTCWKNRNKLIRLYN